MKKHIIFLLDHVFLPDEVLKQASKSILNFNNNLSLIEISHRSKPFDDVMNEAKSLVREFLICPEWIFNTFLTRRCKLQFSMVPYNLMKINGISCISKYRNMGIQSN